MHFNCYLFQVLDPFQNQGKIKVKITLQNLIFPLLFLQSDTYTQFASFVGVVQRNTSQFGTFWQKFGFY